MLAEHHSSERTPGARGRAFGLAQREAVTNTVNTYRRLLQESGGITPPELPALGGTMRESLGSRWPDLVEEIEGIAQGAGVDALELLAINARTELLGGRRPGECSVVGEVHASRVRLAQNWDWHPALGASTVLWTVESPDGRWFTTLTEAGMLAKIGLNSGGLACALNFLTSSRDGGLGGVPIHVLLRVVLDRCETLCDALAVLLDSSVTASSCITLAGAEDGGNGLVAVELSPGGARTVWPDRGGRLIHTNHFLAPPPDASDLQPAEHPSTLLRLDSLERHIGSGGSPEEALRCHFPAPEPVCRHAAVDAPWSELRATLASVVLDPAGPSFRVADGPPCENPYRDLALPA